MVNFDKFDDMGGTRVLESVIVSIDGMVEGNARVESEGSAPQTIETNLQATISLSDAMMNTLVVSIPTITNVFNAEAFDGILDFAGTSGITYPDLAASEFASETYTDAATLAFFTGTGSQAFTFDAEASSTATGGGNITSSFNSSAGGDIRVVYQFSEVVTNVSAPAQLGLLGLGLLAFAGFRKTK